MSINEEIIQTGRRRRRLEAWGQGGARKVDGFRFLAYERMRVIWFLHSVQLGCSSLPTGMSKASAVVERDGVANRFVGADVLDQLDRANVVIYPEQRALRNSH